MVIVASPDGIARSDGLSVRARTRAASASRTGWARRVRAAEQGRSRGRLCRRAASRARRTQNSGSSHGVGAPQRRRPSPTPDAPDTMRCAPRSRTRRAKTLGRRKPGAKAGLSVAEDVSSDRRTSDVDAKDASGDRHASDVDAKDPSASASCGSESVGGDAESASAASAPRSNAPGKFASAAVLCASASTPDVEAELERNRARRTSNMSPSYTTVVSPYAVGVPPATESASAST
jgi:hypothetical protein